MGGKIVQVFMNILQNALSFNPKEDKIGVIMEMKDGSALFACADRGPGIPDDILPRLFEPFASKRKGGTGLGLAIVRQIVNAHGGTVEASNNNPPPGAHFEITLPLHAPNG